MFQHFEDLIRQNFRVKGADLLRSCEAYLQGAPVRMLFTHDFVLVSLAMVAAFVTDSWTETLIIHTC